MTIAQTPLVDLDRVDTHVTSDPGVHIFVREVSAMSGQTNNIPVILLHGARVPGVASFDLPVEGYSLAADLARQGHRVYVMDARGYGFSTRPPAMNQPQDANRPLVRSDEVVRDLGAVVDWVRSRTGSLKVALLGWATGGHWAGMYASLHPDRVSHLVFYNSLYGGTDGHDSLGRGSDYEDPNNPGRFNIADTGAYRLNSASSLLPSWDSSIPVENKTQWYDPRVVSAYQQAALESDETSPTRNPPSFRAPSGAIEDSFYLATGRQLWDASLVKANTLILRSENDFWSRPQDAQLLQEHLVRAAGVRIMTLPDATHYVHLDRPERGRTQFISEVSTFLSR